MGSTKRNLTCHFAPPALPPLTIPARTMPMRLPIGWPSTTAQSTSSTTLLTSPAAFNLVSAMLTTFELDEVSTTSVAGYIFLHGMVAPTKSAGKVVQRGVMVWVYPSGKTGPFEVDDAVTGDMDEHSRVVFHGLLVTVERGALFDEVVEGIQSAQPFGGIAHAHFKGSLTEWEIDEQIQMHRVDINDS